MASQLESAGAQVRNPSRGKPIHIARMETGLFTNRNGLHEPVQFVISKFYGGYVDALIDGGNMEISNQLTLIRRPGLSAFSTVNVPNPPNWFYDWRTLDQGIKVIVDTPVATYIQTPTTQTQIFTKTGLAGQGYYQGVGDTLFVGDGVDLQKYVLPGGTVWNWGIVAPLAAPNVTSTPTASSSSVWTASTVYSTMGLIVDSNGNVQQMISVNASGTNTTQFGTTGNGQPAWNQTPGGATPDNGFNWTNWGPIVLRKPNTTYNNGASGGTLANPATVYDPV